MKKCCDSCRYFQKRNDLAGKGWCRHPQRVDVNSDLVLVRASQLDCRKEWDQNLWEPISFNHGAPVRHDRARTLGPVPPATPAEIAWILKSTRDDESGSVQAASTGEDRFVGAAPSPIRNVPKVLLKQPPTVPVDSPDVKDEDEKAPDKRVTILRAREVQRARATNRMRPSPDPLPSSDSTRAATPPGSAPDVETDTLFAPPLAPATPPAPVPPVTLEKDVINSVANPPTIETPDAPSEPIVPSEATPSDQDLSSADTWRQPTVSAPVERDVPPPMLRLIHGKRTRTPDDAILEPTSVEDVVDIDRVVVSDNTMVTESDIVVQPVARGETVRPERTRIGRKPSRKPQGASFSFQNRWMDARPEPSNELNAPLGLTTDGARSSITPVTRADRRDHHFVDTVEKPDVADFGFLPDLDDRSPVAPFVPLGGDVWQYDDGAVEQDYEPVGLLSDWKPPAHPAVLDQDDVVVRNDSVGPVVFDPLIDDYVIHPDVPRMCKTCSAFRTGDNVERGWCSNGWAFDNRTFVSSTGVPCASSIGDWWLPSDAFWDDGLLERLGSPAPLYDREFAPKHAPPRQRVAPRRSRRR